MNTHPPPSSLDDPDDVWQPLRPLVAWQPIVSLDTLATVGFEALLRTSDRRSPLDVFKAAVRHDRVDQVERAMQEQIAAQLSAGVVTTRVFVNLHPHTLASAWFFRTDAPLVPVAEWVVLELPEAHLPIPEEVLAGRLDWLRRQGFRLAVDDHGVDHATEDRARRLAPDILKLDRSLLAGLTEGGSAGDALRRALEFAAEEELEVVVEGVESPTELEFLRRLGVTLVQGRAVGRPVVTDLSALGGVAWDWAVAS